MKIKASSEKGVQILSLSEEVSARDLVVLKAGIANLLKNGKNQIVVELTQAQVLPSEILRELAYLEILARELSGRIVLAGLNKDSKSAISRFASPPVLEGFGTRLEAVEWLVNPPKPEAPKVASHLPLDAPAPVAPTASAPAASPPVNEDEIKNFRSEMRDLEKTQLGPLRKRVADLEAENTMLRALIGKVTLERKLPPNAAAYEGRIKVLEAEIEKDAAV